jgi:3-keto-disaccharide hydrolase
MKARILAGLFPAVFVNVLTAAEPARPSLDLLAQPLETARPYAWKHFSENSQTKLSEVWQLRDGVLVCRGTPKGYLYLDHDFTNFILRLEWRWPEGKKPGNGGVLIRLTGPDRIWPRSLEAQLNTGEAGDFWGLDGFALDGPAGRKKTLDHPQFGKLTNLKRTADLEQPAGQWNQYEIIARGSTVILRVNGQEANRATGCDVRAGRICFTAEGDEIHFRNVHLQELPARGDHF